MSRVVIVARTRMRRDPFCIGGHDLDKKFRPVRLQNKYGDSWYEDAPFRVGQIWNVKYRERKSHKPHVEDVMIDEYNLLGTVDDLKAVVLRHARPWTGSWDALFDRTVRYDSTGAHYVPAKGKLPKCSTGYWIPSTRLDRRMYGGRVRFVWNEDGSARGLPWVGAQEPPECIEPAALVRVSLTRLFASETSPEGYYVQISGVM